MLKVLECHMVEPLRMLKIYGVKEATFDGDILIYNSDILLGKAMQDIWAIKKKDWEKGQGNWVFTKVLDSVNVKRLKIEVRDKNETVLYREEIKVKSRKDIPGYLASSIGSKNNLTINTGKDTIEEFTRKQEQCGYKPGLEHLTIESSSLCNLSCKYCVTGNNYKAIERGVISEEIFRKAIDTANRLYDQGLRIIQLNALGEPLTNSHFVNMVQSIYQETKIRHVLFFTNGMLFTKEISDAIAEIPMYFQITFSLDGNSPEENNSYRRGSDYETVKKNIYYFLHRIAGKENFTIRINNLQISEQEQPVVIPEHLLNDFGFIKVDSHRAFYSPRLSKRKLWKEAISFYAEKEKRVCMRIFNEATIRSNGDVIQCCWDSTCEIVMGNILEQSLEDIWEGEKYVSFRKNMLYGGMEKLPAVCRNCHAQNNGVLYRKENFLSRIKKRFRKRG